MHIRDFNANSALHLLTDHSKATLMNFHLTPILYLSLLLLSAEITDQMNIRTDLPAKFDLRNVNGVSFLPPVRDQFQDQCGSCVSFATIAAAEGSVAMKFRLNPNSVDFSEGALYFCDGGRTCNGANAGWMSAISSPLVEKVGVYQESDYPYKVQESCDNAQLLKQKPRAAYKFKSQAIHNPKEIKSWLMQNGPVIVGFTVLTDFPSTKLPRR